MTRPIKFRVWDGSKMVDDVVVGKFGAFYVNPGIRGDGLDEKDAGSLTPMNTIYSGNVPVMQFTGLADKNGKEIYEGDIVRGESYKDPVALRTKTEVIGVVKWEHRFGAPGFDIDCKLPKGFRTFLTFRNCEVIGNIYENVEYSE